MNRSWTLLLVLLSLPGCSLLASKTGEPPSPPPCPPRHAIATTWPEPLAAVPVGAWARWRIALDDAVIHRELTLMHRVEGRAWLEEITDPEGREEVAWRLVDARGEVLYGVRGRPGAMGRRVPIQGDADPDILDGATDTGAIESIEVGGTSLACRKLRLIDDMGTAWVCADVPFGGLVRIRQEGIDVDLLAHGRGRTRARLTNALPAWPPRDAESR